MTVDIHPEDLIDKLEAGEISAPERARLRAHLSQCAGCRFELSVRGDLAAEMPAIGERPQLGLGASLELREPAVEPTRAASALGAGRRRTAFVLIAAALVLCATGAAAVTGAGERVLPWAFRSSARQLERAPNANAVAKPSSQQTAPSAASVVAPVSTNDVALPSNGASEPTTAAEPSAPSPLPAKVALAPIATATAALASAGASTAPSAPVSIDFAAAVGSSAPSMASAVPDAPAAPEDAAAVFSEANRARRDGNAERAELLYRSLQARFAGSAESELSREVLAQMQLERGNATGALAGFDRYLAGGSSGLAAEARVGRARALEQLGQRDQAAAAWRDVQRRYPGTVHARLAATRLAALDPE